MAKIKIVALLLMTSALIPTALVLVLRADQTPAPSAALSAQPVADNHANNTAPLPGPAPDVVVAGKLQRQVRPLQLRNVRFDRCLVFYRDVTTLNVAVDWNTLELAGIESKAPITIRFDSGTAEDFLQQLLMAESPDHKLDYDIRNGSIEVSTTQAFSPFIETRVYDVSDLLSAPTAVTSPAVTLPQLIMSKVMPQSWIANGGKTGDLSIAAGQLIVTATPAGHRRVANFLEQIRHPAN